MLLLAVLDDGWMEGNLPISFATFEFHDNRFTTAVAVIDRCYFAVEFDLIAFAEFHLSQTPSRCLVMKFLIA